MCKDHDVLYFEHNNGNNNNNDNNSNNNNSNNNNRIDVLLRTGEFLDIKIDYFNKNLKPLVSRHSMLKVFKITVSKY